MQHTTFKVSSCVTPLGTVMAVADDKKLCLLQFVEKRDLKQEIQRFSLKARVAITAGVTGAIESIEAELRAYFNGTLTKFNTPLHLLGTSFQQQAWQALRKVPYGHTRSYLEQAQQLGRPTAYRAVANANGANPLVIVIPCHRIINHDGKLGGYSSGIARKQWLLAHEQRIAGI